MCFVEGSLVRRASSYLEDNRFASIAARVTGFRDGGVCFGVSGQKSYLFGAA